MFSHFLSIQFGAHNVLMMMMIFFSSFFFHLSIFLFCARFHLLVSYSEYKHFYHSLVYGCALLLNCVLSCRLHAYTLFWSSNWKVIYQYFFSSFSSSLYLLRLRCLSNIEMVKMVIANTECSMTVLPVYKRLHLKYRKKNSGKYNFWREIESSSIFPYCIKSCSLTHVHEQKGRERERTRVSVKAFRLTGFT